MMKMYICVYSNIYVLVCFSFNIHRLNNLYRDISEALTLCWTEIFICVAGGL